MDNLRTEIQNKTRGHKIPSGTKVSRTFYVPVSEEIEKIKSWYTQWFPLQDRSLENIYIWLPATGDKQSQQVKDNISTAWRDAMGANTIKEVTTKGYVLLDSSVQIIFLVDLSDKNGFALLESTKKIFDEIIESWATSATIYFSCIVVLRNYDEKTKNLLHPVNSEGFFDWCSINIHRLYTVDIQNLQGTFISRPKDMLFFLGQLLRYLSSKPVEASNEGSLFAEWINQINAGDSKATAFSATSFLFPIDYVLDVCLVRKGAEQIEKALFSDPASDRVQLFVNSVKNKNGLNSHSVLSEHVFSGSGQTPQEEPLRIIDETLKSNNPKSFSEEIDLHLTTYKAVDSALPGMAKTITEKYFEQSANVPLSFYFSLSEHVDKALAEETGSLKILDKMFVELSSHIDSLKPEESLPQAGRDVNVLLNRLEKERINAPAGMALLARMTILLVLLAVTAIGFTLNGNLTFTVLTSLALLLTGGYLVYTWYASKKRVEKLYMQIESVLNKKWTSLKTTVQNTLIEKIKEQCLGQLKDIKEQTIKVATRLKDVVEFGKNSYAPPQPIDSAFWMNVINTREEALGFLDKIQDPEKAEPLGVFNNKETLELWNRLCFTGEKELNPWEISILEKAATDLLPNTQKLINTSVCELLEADQAKFNNYKRLMSNCCEPFTAVNRLDIKDSEAIIELPSDGCKAAGESLSEDIRQQFQKMSIQDSGTNYRISFLSFAEGLDFSKILDTIKQRT